ncbi:putative 2'-5' RNA ligase, partial [Bordetella bronchiseptica MO211]
RPGGAARRLVGVAARPGLAGAAAGLPAACHAAAQRGRPCRRARAAAAVAWRYDHYALVQSQPWHGRASYRVLARTAA